MTLAFFNKHSIHDSFLEEHSAEMPPPHAIHRCLEHIWKHFNLRARLFLSARGKGLDVKGLRGGIRL